MYDFKPQAGADAAIVWEDLLSAVDGVTKGEPDPIANMANVAALLWELVPDLNWAGFYRMVAKGEGHELVLGPFQGRAACIRIALGAGVCGTAAATGETQLVEDVHAFPGHIACDAASASELVVPIVIGGQVVGVLDLDSPTPARFTSADAAGAERLCALLSERLAG
jgi:L-methionine (R)-S-oxide reductase